MNLDRVIAVRNTKTVYRDGDRCIKIFNGERTKAEVLNEAFNQALAEQMGFRVPKILEVTVVDGKWAIVSELIRGRAMSDTVAAEPELAEEYLTRLVELQLEVQREMSPLYENLAEKARRGISAARGSGANISDGMQELIGALADRNNICHGDFTPSNLIVSESGELYILDWDHASRGAPEADAAGTYLCFRRNGDVLAQRYLEIYCEKSAVPRAEVEKWLPLVAAAQYTNAEDRVRKFLLPWFERENNF